VVPDMPDRIIAATALSLSLPLVTRDAKIQAVTTIQTIW
jgi:predicted nucleic acid-binding protein